MSGISGNQRYYQNIYLFMLLIANQYSSVASFSGGLHLHHHNQISFSPLNYRVIAPTARKDSFNNVVKHQQNKQYKRSNLQMSDASTGAAEPLYEKFGKGIGRDWKARFPLYKSDIKDGLNSQVSSWFFVLDSNFQWSWCRKMMRNA